MAATANPINAVIQLKDSLALTEEQLAKLKPLSDTLAARNATLGAEMRKVVQDAGANRIWVPCSAASARYAQLQKQNGDAMREVEKILTSEQWAKVPERVKRGQMPGMGGQQGRQEGRRPPE